MEVIARGTGLIVTKPEYTVMFTICGTLGMLHVALAFPLALRKPCVLLSPRTGQYIGSMDQKRRESGLSGIVLLSGRGIPGVVPKDRART